MTERSSSAESGFREASGRASLCPDPIGSPFGLLTLLVLLVCVLLGASPVSAQTFPAGFVNTTVGGYWPELAGFTFDDVGTMYAWERAGRIWILENDVKLPTPLLDIREEVGPGTIMVSSESRCIRIFARTATSICCTRSTTTT